MNFEVDPAGLLADTLQTPTSAALLAMAGDVSLLLDGDGTVLDIAADDRLLTDGISAWRGRPFSALVTVEGKPKISELVADARAGRKPRWRQVTHALRSGEVPVRYACFAAGDRLVAIGRDMRAEAAVQQRLLQAQQSLERDYLRFRQAEARYRLLFDVVEEATIIVDAGSWRIADANAAAHRLLGSLPGGLVGQPVGTIADAGAREGLLADLGGAVAGAADGRRLLLRGGKDVSLSAVPFRQDRATFLLLRLEAPGAATAPKSDDNLHRVVEEMPDAFVLAGRSLAVVAANAAFLDLVAAPSAAAVIGEPLGTWLGRPGVDVELMVAELRKSGAVRNVATIVRGTRGGFEEVELSAVLVEADGEQHIGIVLRGVARRLRDLPPTERDLPRSVEQLTELVGRLSLKEIVRESTDLIERLCIDAALTYTADNRASAAELLGLSRQGLYTKLHRHGLGNLVAGE